MKTFLTSTLLACSALALHAQDINLPAANLQRSSKSMVETLAQRHSVREFAETKLTEQELSDLCWAACGVSRDNEHRTAPTARNRKEIRLFVFTDEAAYEYEPVENRLRHVAAGDHRSLVAGTAAFKQDFVMQAPVSLVMVIDYDRFGGRDAHAEAMCPVDAGIVCQNINLYCESVGLVTVPRATMDAEGIRQLLGLTDAQVPIMNNPVGKPVVQKQSVKRVYDESIDPMKQMDEALARAKQEGKNVICQIGGNWCKWCLRFADFITKDEEIAAMIDANYVYIHVNYSDDSTPALKQRLGGNPGRFGYPALVVLSADGKVLHTQDSSFLESGDGYSTKKVLRFLKKWTPESVK